MDPGSLRLDYGARQVAQLLVHAMLRDRLRPWTDLVVVVCVAIKCRPSVMPVFHRPRPSHVGLPRQMPVPTPLMRDLVKRLVEMPIPCRYTRSPPRYPTPARASAPASPSKAAGRE